MHWPFFADENKKKIVSVFIYKMSSEEDRCSFTCDKKSREA